MLAVISLLLGRVRLGVASIGSADHGSGPAGSVVPNVRVLTYHRFGPSWHDPFCLDLADFEAQMAWLAKTQRAISLEALERFLKGQQALPHSAVVVTIDDGYQSIRQALPILVKYQIPAVVFLTVSKIRAADSEALEPELPEPHLTWTDVKQLEAAGITVASHGWTHRSLGQMTWAELEQEAKLSRAVLESHLVKPVRAFAYPFGTRADFNARTAAALQDQYQLIFTSQHGAIQPGLSAAELPRIKVESGEPLWLFQLLTCGGLDAWGLIDQTLWRLQQTPAAS